MKIYILLYTFISGLLLSSFAQDDFTIEHYLKGVSVADITGKPDDLWIATNNDGIYNFNSASLKWEHYSSANGSIDQDFFYSIDKNDKFVWAGSADGLFTFNIRRKSWQKRKFGKGGQLGNWIRTVKYDKYDDCLWIGRFQYLTKYDLSKRRFTDYDLTIKKDSKSNSIKAIELEGRNIVWFGTEGGLHKYDKRKNLENESSRKFYDNSLNYFKGEGDKVSVNSLFSGNAHLWIGLEEFKTTENPNYNLGGLYKFDRNFTWDKIDQSDGLTGNGINCITNTGKYLWVSVYSFANIGTQKYGKGLAIIDLSDYKVIKVTDERIPLNINKVFYDSENIWIGAETGLYKINITNEFAKFE